MAYLSLFFTGIVLIVSISVSSTCYINLYGPNGVFRSPKFPGQYDNNTNCTWRINSGKSGATIILSIEVLDIESDEPVLCGYRRPCCKHNWLQVPMPTTGKGKLKSQQLCGTRPPLDSISVKASQVMVKMYTSKITKGGRGFQIAYKIEPQECSIPDMVPCGPDAAAGCYHNMTQRCDGIADCAGAQDEAGCNRRPCHHLCADGRGCYTAEQKCDGTPDCSDFSDEIDCGFCEKKGEVLCSSDRHHCFHPAIQLCNGRFECPWGEDEVGCVPACPEKIACSSGEGCYTPSQRCNTLSDCMDWSDEAQCPAEICSALHDKRLCHNGRCLPATLWCDGQDDCGDNTDEAACVKNSLIALAIMGCLFCGLLLVIAVGCAFRIYGHRYPSRSNYHLHISPRLASRLRMSTSVSLPTLVDDEFFHREPPPAYSVAVGARESEHSLPIVPPSRPRRLRRQRLRPVPPPQVAAKLPDTSPGEEASSSQSSPSRGSITSSSYVSGTDDTLLLSS